MYGLNNRKTLFPWQINGANGGVSATGGGVGVLMDEKASSIPESAKMITGWLGEDMSLVNQVNIIIYEYKYK